MKNIANYYFANGKKLQRYYKHQVGGYKEWKQLLHVENISSIISQWRYVQRILDKKQISAL